MASMHHVVAGSGSPPIVFVHGLACSHTDWQAQVAHFSARHMTVAVDLPGHGATPGTVADCSMEGYGAALAGLLRTRAMPPAVLVGHSLGCRVVLEAAQSAPEHVAGIGLVDGSRFAPEAAQIFEARFAAGEYVALARGMFAQMFTPGSDAGTVAAVVDRALRLPEPMGQALLLALVRYDVEKFESVLESLRKPLLVLQTTFVNDKRVRLTMQPGQTTPYLDFIRAKVPAARVEVVCDVGHFPQLDAPAETNRALESFVATLA
jgi:pimeloyl-ACP methyl ester carboxylesterase